MSYTVAPPTTALSGTILDCTNWVVATSSDTCATLASYNGLTDAQLFSYNPSLAASGCPIVVGDSYCIEENWGIPPTTTASSATSAPPSTTSTTSTGNGVSTPSPIQTGMTTSCDAFYYVVSGDGCVSIASHFGITLDQFYAWNPAVGSDCTSLWLSTYVCVGTLGQATVTTTTTTTASSMTASSTTTTGNGISTPTPTQTGMVRNCDSFHYVVSGDSCPSIASQYGISLAQFYAWNPAVGSDCTSLWLNTYCCVGIVGQTASTSTSATSSTSSTTSTTTGNGVSTPTPTQTGMVSNCNTFHYVVSGDGCSSIASQYGITAAQFYAWNPAVGSSCTSLWLNTYCCVGVIGQTASLTTLTTRTTSTSTGNGVSTPSPIETPMTSNCKTFHYVVSGDTCAAIATAAGIALSDLYAWNPALGSSCSSLWLNAYVCIGVLP
ncbi:hypothetical protein C8A05DRAFT_47255 [Staphylotrichum tortipilum]|uniref:LysM domain-containing protein n=1 Tax=Staphylotrichum tortipilum TaxID=2831512 RepID=A0AAN6ME07_9PEZI|nr:hypothetical protein C8A05DRAFT_47255 [Staphylotrichum longicolle]